jgi:hypothetical protein
MRILASWSAGLALVLCNAAFARADTAFTVELPNYEKPHSEVWLDQGWDKPSAEWFHHADQGTLTFSIPYEWFVALDGRASWPLIGDSLALYGEEPKRSQKLRARA